MAKSERILLELLKAGLWERSVDEGLFECVNWMEIYEIAEKQSITGVAFDGIERLQKKLLPPMDLLMDWLGQTNYLETQNQELNKSVASLVKLLDYNGFASRLLKGQGCASYYPKPLHRQCGDIDLYVGTKQYDGVKALIHDQGIEDEDETRVHTHFQWDGATVELHRLVSGMYCYTLNNRLSLLVDKWVWISPRVFVADSCRVAIINPTFNCFYIFLHLYEHFLQLGVGLRQICDWILVMHHEQSHIDWKQVRKFVDAVECRRAWTAFYELAVRYLGLVRIPVLEEVFGVEQNSQLDNDVEFLISDIFAGGNFGKHGVSMKSRKMGGGIAGNLGSYIKLLKRLFKVWKFGRREVLYYPLYKLTHGVRS